MASRPNLVPEDQPWLVLGAMMNVVAEKPSMRECLEWVLGQRDEGCEDKLFIYGPHSCHEHAVINKVAWERTGG